MMLDKNNWKKPLICIIVITLLLTYAFPWITSRQVGTTTAAISIAFKGAGNGQDPMGNRFDINELKSDKVLSAAIKASGLKDSVTLSQLKSKIYILPHADDDTLKELSTLTTINGKTQDIKERIVYPTSFVIGLKDMGMPSFFTDKKLLKNILKAYTDHMKSKYLSDTTGEPAYSEEEILDMDYPEMMGVLNQNAESLLRYIGAYADNEPQFVSKEKGLTFEDVYQQAKVLKDTDIGNMRSLVNHYRLTLDPQNRIKYEETLLKRAIVVANKLQGAEWTAAEIINIYNNSSNFIFTAGDTSALNLAPLENQFYSDLMSAMVEKQTSFIDAKYSQQDILRAISKLQTGVITEEQYAQTTADIKAGTKEALKKMEELRTLTKTLAGEFYDTDVNSKINVSGVSYNLNTFGNLILNFVILLGIAMVGNLLIMDMNRFGYGKYLNVIRNLIWRKHGKD